MEYTLREFRIGDPHDAELLAAMWNASDAGWPGGWTGGIPETAERILDRTSKADCIAMFIVEVDDEIVGYGDLVPMRGRDDCAYLGLLNVRPDFHGRKLGKALVLQVLDRTIELGYAQLGIDTWAGNKKSVPLYKKTGFFWIPDTSADMQNYIPTALAMPIAKPFFAKHDWYDCFERELELAPDDIEWNGIKVFPYRFEEDGDLFTMWVDRQAEAPTAVETHDLYAACSVGKEEVVCGLEQTVRWEITNKKDVEQPLQVALIAKGEEGIGLNVVENFDVADKAVIEESFTVSPNIKPKEEGMPSHQIVSTILINGVPVTLGTAVKPMQPVDIQFDTQTVIPGKPEEKVVVKLKSNLDFPVKGELLIDPHPSLNFDKLSAPFILESKSWTSCTFYVQVNDPGAYTTKMRAVCPSDLNPDCIPSGSSLTTKSKSVIFFTQPLDSVDVWHDDERKTIWLGSPSMWARVNLRGGDISIGERLSGRHVCTHRAPELGPPFIGWRHVKPIYKYRLERKDGKASVTLIIPSDNAPGVTIEKTITFGAGNYIRVDHRILNTTSVTQKFKLRCGARNNLAEAGRGKLTLPLKDGLLHNPYEGWGGFPMGDRDLSKKPEDYAESWSAIENSGVVCGIVFGECEEREDNMTLQFDLPEIPPQSHHDLEPFYIVAARGNWEVVRQLWRWLKQPSTVREERKPIAHPALNAGFEPAPFIITQSEMDAKLGVRSLRGRSPNGKWQIKDCNLQIQPTDGELVDIKRGNPFVQDVNITKTDLMPRVESAKVLVTNESTTCEFESPVVILGSADQPVKINSESSEDKPSTISVDNGYFSFTVAPAFLGSVIALEHCGLNHLHSAYPKAIPYSWMNPWFGGIHPYIGWMGDHRIVKEKFTGEPIQRKGKRGIAWHGVKVGSDLEHKDRCWGRIELEYLTFGGSNVLAMVQRFINRTDAPQHQGNVGTAIWPAVSGSVADSVIHYLQSCPCYEQAASTDDHVQVQRHLRLGEYGFEPPSGRWIAAQNPKTGDALTVIASHPDTRAGVQSEGKEFGNTLWTSGWFSLEPNETKERVFWLVIGDSLAEMRKYRVLGEIWELP